MAPSTARAVTRPTRLSITPSAVLDRGAARAVSEFIIGASRPHDDPPFVGGRLEKLRAGMVPIGAIAGTATKMRKSSVIFRIRADKHDMFEWKDEHSLGVAAMDDQHRELFRIAADLTRAILEGRAEIRFRPRSPALCCTPQRTSRLRRH